MDSSLSLNIYQPPSTLRRINYFHSPSPKEPQLATPFPTSSTTPILSANLESRPASSRDVPPTTNAILPPLPTPLIRVTTNSRPTSRTMAPLVKPCHCDWSTEDGVIFQNMVLDKEFVALVHEVTKDDHDSRYIWRGGNSPVGGVAETLGEKWDRVLSTSSPGISKEDGTNSRGIVNVVRRELLNMWCSSVFLTLEARRNYQREIQGRLVGKVLRDPICWEFLDQIALEASDRAKTAYIDRLKEAQGRIIRDVDNDSDEEDDSDMEGKTDTDTSAVSAGSE
uniref:Uncharacterized protein n=1 Tax=Timema tahoe TaxID=61484 RepID=A0A7R9IN37_9NEOP|nr:unnamed protein product [Timema tahoe]